MIPGNIRLKKLVLNHVGTLSLVFKKPEFSNCWREVPIGRPIALQSRIKTIQFTWLHDIARFMLSVSVAQGFLLRCHYSDRTGKSPFVQVLKRFQICQSHLIFVEFFIRCLKVWNVMDNRKCAEAWIILNYMLFFIDSEWCKLWWRSTFHQPKPFQAEVQNYFVFYLYSVFNRST